MYLLQNPKETGPKGWKPDAAKRDAEAEALLDKPAAGLSMEESAIVLAYERRRASAKAIAERPPSSVAAASPSRQSTQPNPQLPSLPAAQQSAAGLPPQLALHTRRHSSRIVDVAGLYEEQLAEGAELLKRVNVDSMYPIEKHLTPAELYLVHQYLASKGAKAPDYFHFVLKKWEAKERASLHTDLSLRTITDKINILAYLRRHPEEKDELLEIAVGSDSSHDSSYGAVHNEDEEDDDSDNAAERAQLPREDGDATRAEARDLMKMTKKEEQKAKDDAAKRGASTSEGIPSKNVDDTATGDDDGTEGQDDTSTPADPASSNDALVLQQRRLSMFNLARTAGLYNESETASEAPSVGATSPLTLIDGMHRQLARSRLKYTYGTEHNAENFGLPGYALIYESKAGRMTPYDSSPRLLFSIDKTASGQFTQTPMWTFGTPPLGSCVPIATELSRLMHTVDADVGRRSATWMETEDADQQMGHSVRKRIEDYVTTAKSDDLRRVLGVSKTLQADEAKVWDFRRLQCYEGELGEEFLGVYSLMTNTPVRELRYFDLAPWRCDQHQLDGYIVSNKRYCFYPDEPPHPESFPFDGPAAIPQASILLYAHDMSQTLSKGAHADALVRASDYFDAFNLHTSRDMIMPTTLLPVAYVAQPTVFYTPGISYTSTRVSKAGSKELHSACVRINQVFSFTHGVKSFPALPEHDPNDLWLVVATIIRVSSGATENAVSKCKQRAALSRQAEQVEQADVEDKLLAELLQAQADEIKTPVGLVLLLRLDGITKNTLSDSSIRDCVKQEEDIVCAIVDAEEIINLDDPLDNRPSWKSGVQQHRVPLAKAHTADGFTFQASREMGNKLELIPRVVQMRRPYVVSQGISRSIIDLLLQEQCVAQKIKQKYDDINVVEYQPEFDAFVAGVHAGATSSIDCARFESLTKLMGPLPRLTSTEQLSTARSSRSSDIVL
jgi:hypothetical protein